jgi:hypothetical protein
MSKIIRPGAPAILKHPLRPPYVEEVDEIQFLTRQYGVRIPETARQLILERAFRDDRDAKDRSKRPSKKP